MRRSTSAETQTPMRRSEAQLPPHPLDGQWHISIDGKTYGPYTGHELLEMVNNQQLYRSDFVFADGASEWAAAEDDPVLRTLFGVQIPTVAQPDAPSRDDRKARRSRAAIWAVVGALLIIGWVVWPYYALYDLLVALRTGDALALENRINWDSVRQGLRADLNALLLQTLDKDKDSAGAGLAVMLLPVIVNQAIDNFVTPTAIANAIRNPKPATVTQDNSAKRSEDAAEKMRHLSMRHVTFAFFAGGPATFEVHIKPEEAETSRLVLSWAGDWKLTRVFIPQDIMRNIPSAAKAMKAADQDPKIEGPMPVEVVLVSKGFKNKNIQAGEFQDYITFDLKLINKTDRDIRAFDGTVIFRDLLDNRISSVKLVIDDPLGRDETRRWSGLIKYNQFDNNDQRLRDTSDANIKVAFSPRKVLFQDGTSQDYER
jgi:hypothetical protein